MNTEETRPEEAATPLPCSHIVYRAMSRKDWIDPETNSVLPGAFFRRPPPKDLDGVSLDTTSPKSCASTLKKCHGVASLHVGRLRDLGLDVVPGAGSHAAIAGLPDPQADTAMAERLASQLARQARVVASK